MTRDPDELLRLLYTYGEHKWQCPITVTIRENRRFTSEECDCGWDAIGRELYELGVKRL